MMKSILCYGDSNTWGFNPETQSRFDEQTRWTGVMSASLGSEYRIIEEGLNGRTTVFDDPISGPKNGLTYLLPCLESHQPLDLVILALGVNDLKKRFSLPATDIADGVRRLVQVIQQQGNAFCKIPAPQVLIVAPPPTAKLTLYSEMFEGAEEKSKLLAKHYLRVSKETNCAYLDAGSVIKASPLDGIHFELEEHKKLGQALADQVKNLLGG